MKIFEIILTAIISITVALNVGKSSKLKFRDKFLIIGGIILAFVVAYNAIQEFNKSNLLEKINASYGDIDDIQDATLPAIGLGMLDDAPRIVLNGTGTFSFKGQNGFFQNLLKAYIKENKLYINMVVYDSTGIPALGIFENTWKVYNNEFEYNYDQHAIKLVTNGSHLVLFHLVLKNGIANIEASIYTPQSDTNRLNGFKGIKINTSSYGGDVSFLSGSKSDINSSIPPIFKYPREKYLGVRVHY